MNDEDFTEEEIIELSTKNDSVVGLVVKCTKEQSTKIFEAIKSVFPNAYLIYAETTTIDNNLYIVNKQKLLAKKEAKKNGSR